MTEFIRLNALQNMPTYSDNIIGGNIVSENIEKVKIAFGERDYMYLIGVAVVLAIAYYVLRWLYNRYMRPSIYDVPASYDDAQDKYMHQIVNNDPYY